MDLNFSFGFNQHPGYLIPSPFSFEHNHKYILYSNSSSPNMPILWPPSYHKIICTALSLNHHSHAPPENSKTIFPKNINSYPSRGWLSHLFLFHFSFLLIMRPPSYIVLPTHPIRQDVNEQREQRNVKHLLQRYRK